MLYLTSSMRRYYDRYRSSGAGIMPKLILVVVLVVGVFIFRQDILRYLNDNPQVDRYVPSFITSALERDLEDWKQEDLQARYQQLSTEVEGWQQKLVKAKATGEGKLEEIQTNLNQAREALEETKAALDKLAEAGENLKAVVSPTEEATEEN